MARFENLEEGLRQVREKVERRELDKEEELREQKRLKEEERETDRQLHDERKKEIDEKVLTHKNDFGGMLKNAIQFSREQREEEKEMESNHQRRQDEDRQREEDRQQGRKKEEEEDEQRRLQNQDEDRQREEEKKKLHQLQVEQLKDVVEDGDRQLHAQTVNAKKELKEQGEEEGRKFQQKVDNEKAEVGGMYVGLKQLVLDNNETAKKNAKTSQEFSDTVENSTTHQLKMLDELQKRLKPGNNDGAMNLVRIMIIS
jgi:hypothetical protein